MRSAHRRLLSLLPLLFLRHILFRRQAHLCRSDLYVPTGGDLHRPSRRLLSAKTSPTPKQVHDHLQRPRRLELVLAHSQPFLSARKGMMRSQTPPGHWSLPSLFGV